MTIREILTAADLDTIAAQIGDGAAPVDSWSRPAAGGYMRPDDAREYFCHLASGSSGRRRIARVTVYRDPVGRWTIGDVDTFTADTSGSVTRDDDAARDILAAVETDTRQIVRPVEV